MFALFRALELRAYLSAGCRLPGPVLDLGCGDGTVARMLLEAGVIDEPPMLGLDLRERAVAAARRRGLHRLVVRGDGARLPLADAGLGAVVANGVLCAIETGTATAVAEIRRVLRPGGVFVATVPTDRFDRELRLPQLLGRLSPTAGERMRARFARRADHYVTLPPAAWSAMFEQAGLQVETVRPFLGPSATRMWELLTVQPMRVFALLRFLAQGHALGQGVLRRVVTAAIQRDRQVSIEAAGYVLLVARRPFSA